MSPARARGAPCPTSPGASVNDAVGAARGSRTDAASGREPAGRPEGPGRSHRAAGPGAGVSASAGQRSIKVWVSLGDAGHHRARRSSARPSAPPQSGCSRTGSSWPARPEMRSARLPAGRGRRAGPGARARTAASVALLVNRGGARRELRDARPHRRRRRRAADLLRDARLPRRRRRHIIPTPACPPGIVIRQTPAGGFQVAPGEAISLEVSR